MIEYTLNDKYFLDPITTRQGKKKHINKDTFIRIFYSSILQMHQWFHSHIGELDRTMLKLFTCVEDISLFLFFGSHQLKNKSWVKDSVTGQNDVAKQMFP